MSYRILVPLDGSPLAERAGPIALDIARRTGGSIRFIRVHVAAVPLVAVGDFSGAFYDPAWDDELRRIERAYLEEIVARSRELVPGYLSSLLLDGGQVAESIEAAAADYEADLVVMTTHGSGGSALAWLGSVADAVVRHASHPTLVLPERAPDAPFTVARILVAVDGSQHAARVVEAAAELARLYRAELALLRVIAPPLVGDALATIASEGLDRFGVDRIAEAAKKELDRLAEAQRAVGLAVTAAVVVQANPARAILKHISETEPDVVVLGTQGRGVSRLFLGSTADKVLRGARRPTLILRAPEAPAAV
jgi:nucleotide-binding universal stress UspA family protein